MWHHLLPKTENHVFLTSLNVCVISDKKKTLYLHIVKHAPSTVFNIKGEEVKCSNVAFRLIDDPLTLLVVGVSIRVKGCTNLART